MEWTRKATWAGILTIIGGCFGTIVGVYATVFDKFIGVYVTAFGKLIGELAGIAELASLVELGRFFAVFSGAAIALGIIALIGGIFALRRKLWGMALAGAICALLPIVPLGVLSIIFVSMGKKEFK